MHSKSNDNLLRVAADTLIVLGIDLLLVLIEFCVRKRRKCELLTVNGESCIEACHCYSDRTFLEAILHYFRWLLERLGANETCLGAV